MKKSVLFLAITLTLNIANSQVTNGLVAKYSFNGGNANDEVGSNNGTVMGSTLTTDRFGNTDHAYSFDGSNDYIIVPQNVDNDLNLMTNGISISTWVNITANPSSDLSSIVTKWCGGASEQYGVFLGSAGQNLLAIRVVNNGGVTNPTILSSGNWHHIVFTYDKSTNEHKVYINNTNTLTQTFGGVYSNSPDTTSLSFGAQACDNNGGAPFPSRYFNGKIDDIRIYNRVLNTVDVDSLFYEIDPATLSINDKIENQNSINIYPNPSSDQINFSINSNVKLTNIIGEIVMEEFNVNNLDISNQSSGVYFLIFTDMNGIIIQKSKLVKE